MFVNCCYSFALSSLLIWILKMRLIDGPITYHCVLVLCQYFNISFKVCTLKRFTCIWYKGCFQITKVTTYVCVCVRERESVKERESHWFNLSISLTGQIELYTHIPVMRRIVEQLQTWGFNLCGVFLLDSQFLIDAAKFFSGILAAMSTMVMLEISHVNVLSKIDLLDKQAKKELERYMFCLHTKLYVMC